MQIKFVMTPNVQCVFVETTLQDAARKMKWLDVGTMPVCGDHDRLVGVLTDRDITIRATAQGLDPKVARVRDVMTTDVITCLEDQDLQDATQLMEKHRVRRLVIVNSEHRLAGIISLSDLVIRANKKGATDVLREVSEPAGFHC
jgi:CBS domain-containing protein